MDDREVNLDEAVSITKQLLEIASRPSAGPRMVRLNELIQLGAVGLDDLAELQAAGLRFWTPADRPEGDPVVWCDLGAVLAAARVVAERRERSAARVH